MNDLKSWIDEKKPEVEQIITRNRKPEVRVRRRERDRDEQKIIDTLCILKWKKAEKEGKIKYLSKREWFYDFD